MRGRGMMTASFSRNSDGSKPIARVPSRHGRRRRSTTVPSAVTSSASWATGGRKIYRHKCSSRSVSPARTAALACRSKPSLCAWLGFLRALRRAVDRYVPESDRGRFYAALRELPGHGS